MGLSFDPIWKMPAPVQSRQSSTASSTTLRTVPSRQPLLLLSQNFRQLPTARGAKFSPSSPPSATCTVAHDLQHAPTYPLQNPGSQASLPLPSPLLRPLPANLGYSLSSDTSRTSHALGFVDSGPLYLKQPSTYAPVQTIPLFPMSTLKRPTP